jgi:hypothetical protein
MLEPYMKLMILLVGGNVALGDYAGIVFLWELSDYIGPILMTDWNTTFLPFYFASILYIARLTLAMSNRRGWVRWCIIAFFSALALGMVTIKLTADFLYDKDPDKYLPLVLRLDSI